MLRDHAEYASNKFTDQMRFDMRRWEFGKSETEIHRFRRGRRSLVSRRKPVNWKFPRVLNAYISILFLLSSSIMTKATIVYEKDTFSYSDDRNNTRPLSPSYPPTTASPSSKPSITSSNVPSRSPSSLPSDAKTDMPTILLSPHPTYGPTHSPTHTTKSYESLMPTISPTIRSSVKEIGDLDVSSSNDEKLTDTPSQSPSHSTMDGDTTSKLSCTDDYQSTLALRFSYSIEIESSDDRDTVVSSIEEELLHQLVPMFLSCREHDRILTSVNMPVSTLGIAAIDSKPLDQVSKTSGCLPTMSGDNKCSVISGAMSVHLKDVADMLFVEYALLSEIRSNMINGAFLDQIPGLVKAIYKEPYLTNPRNSVQLIKSQDNNSDFVKMRGLAAVATGFMAVLAISIIGFYFRDRLPNKRARASMDEEMSSSSPKNDPTWFNTSQNFNYTSNTFTRNPRLNYASRTRLDVITEVSIEEDRSDCSSDDNLHSSTECDESFETDLNLYGSRFII